MNISELNDLFRQGDQHLGKFVMTQGVAALPPDKRQQLLALVANFSDFSEYNDPHAEHDFGEVSLDGKDYFWKIDYYDLEYTYGSEDPADPVKTRRVLTIMKTEEY